MACVSLAPTRATRKGATRKGSALGEFQGLPGTKKEAFSENRFLAYVVLPISEPVITAMLQTRSSQTNILRVKIPGELPAYSGISL